MEFEQYLTVARELDDRDVHDPMWWHEKILCSTPERQAMRDVMAFGLAAFLMFLLTSLISPRR